MVQEAFQNHQHMFHDPTQLDLKVTLYPQLGYILSFAGGGINDEIAKDMHEAADLEYAFSSKSDSAMQGEQRYYFRNQTTMQMDNNFGDIHGAIIDMEKELYVDMQNDILDQSELLFSLSGLAAQLDCIIALALAAEDCRLCRPNISAGGRTTVTRGRHLLQELCCDTFIPNDTGRVPPLIHAIVDRATTTQPPSLLLRQRQYLRHASICLQSARSA